MEEAPVEEVAEAPAEEVAPAPAPAEEAEKRFTKLLSKSLLKVDQHLWRLFWFV